MVHVRQEVYLKSSFGTPSIRKVNLPLLPFMLKTKPIDDKPIKEVLSVIIDPVFIKPKLEPSEPPLMEVISPYFGDTDEFKAQVY